MRFSFLAATALALIPPTLVVSTNAFAPKAFAPRRQLDLSLSSTASAVADISTAPIAGMKPGTSGLRKKVEVWQGVDEANKYYVENFIQSLLDTAVENNGGKMLET